MKRRYIIGDGVTIEDDGYNLVASWKEKEGQVGHSVGVKRPFLKLGDTVQVQYSIGRSHFYIREVSDVQGFWMGIKKWVVRAEMEAQQVGGIFGKAGCQIIPKNQPPYFREILTFAYWKVQSEDELVSMSVDDEIVQDYIAMQTQKDMEGEMRFNSAISFTGKTLDWIMKKIGPWVPIEEVPPKVLT